MKNLFVGLGLILAMTTANPLLAQDTELSQDRAEVVEVSEKDDVVVNVNRLSEADKQEINKALREGLDELSKEVLLEMEGLTPEEKAKVVKALRHGLKFDGDDVPAFVGVVAVLAVLLIFGFPVLVLIVVFIYVARKRRQKMDTIKLYIDAGKDVPSQLLNNFDNSGMTSFKSGLIYSGAGIGIIAAFTAAGDESTGALGLIPLFIGIAKLIYWVFEERKQTEL